MDAQINACLDRMEKIFAKMEENIREINNSISKIADNFSVNTEKNDDNE